MQLAHDDALAGVSSTMRQAIHRAIGATTQESVYRFVAGQPAANVAARPGFDADYGDYTGHPADPRTEDVLDGFMTPDEAHDQALMDCQRMPALVVDWLGKAIGDAAPAWEKKGSPQPPVRGLSPNIRSKRKVATLLGGGPKG